jgi:hypothetical protein
MRRAFSVMVLQVFRPNKLVWLCGRHWDLRSRTWRSWPATVAGSGLAPSMLIKAVVELFGLLAVWIIWRLRDQSAHPVSAVTVQPVAQIAGA